jgi:hypothetical protein
MRKDVVDQDTLKKSLQAICSFLGKYDVHLSAEILRKCKHNKDVEVLTKQSSSECKLMTFQLKGIIDRALDQLSYQFDLHGEDEFKNALSTSKHSR